MNTQRIVKTIVMLFLIALLFSTQSEGDITNVFAQSGQSESDYSQEQVEGTPPGAKEPKTSRMNRSQNDCLGLNHVSDPVVKRDFLVREVIKIQYHIDACNLEKMIFDMQNSHGAVISYEEQLSYLSDLVCSVFSNFSPRLGVVCSSSWGMDQALFGTDDFYTFYKNMYSNCKDHSGGISDVEIYVVPYTTFTYSVALKDRGCQVTPQFAQNVFEKDGRCTTYYFDIRHKGDYDDNGKLENRSTSSNCLTSYPEEYQIELPVGEGVYYTRNLGDLGITSDNFEIQQYINWFDRNDEPLVHQFNDGSLLHAEAGVLNEAIWISGHGFMRTHSDVHKFLRGYQGFGDGSPPSWTYVGTYSSLDLDYDESVGQGGVYVNDKFIQKVYEPDGTCHLYSNGHPQNCYYDAPTHPYVEYYDRQFPWEPFIVKKRVYPGRISSYTAWVYEGKFYEALWRTTVGYMRVSSITDHNGGTIHFPGEGVENRGWEACCTSDMFITSSNPEGSAPAGQGGFAYWAPYWDSNDYLWSLIGWE